MATNKSIHITIYKTHTQGRAHDEPAHGQPLLRVVVRGLWRGFGEGHSRGCECGGGNGGRAGVEGGVPKARVRFARLDRCVWVYTGVCVCKRGYVFVCRVEIRIRQDRSVDRRLIHVNTTVLLPPQPLPPQQARGGRRAH